MMKIQTPSQCLENAKGKIICNLESHTKIKMGRQRQFQICKNFEEMLKWKME